MTVARRRRRAGVLLALALACGGLAASQVHTRASEVEAEVGPLVPVVVSRSQIPPGARLRAAQLVVRQVPERFAPRDSAVAPEQVVGQRVGGGLAAGSYVTRGALQAGPAPDEQAGRPIRRGQRSVDVAVAGGEDLGDAPPGTRVDVLVTTEPRSGGASGRTYLALQDVELLGARAADTSASSGGGDGAAARASTIATLRVTLRQAVYLTAAQSFARELRLLVRAPGDRRGERPLEVTAGGL
jgi:pilus assembly protein CpaB